MLGFDTDNQSVFARQYEFAMALPVGTFNVSVLVAPQATPLYHSMKAQNRIVSDDVLAQFPSANLLTNIRPAQMTADDLYVGTKWLINKLFDPDNFYTRLLAMSRLLAPPPWRKREAGARYQHPSRRREHRAGRQEDLYRALFARIASLLPDGGRFYLQTMAFGRNMIPLDRIDIDAPRDSDAWYLALMGRQFPGSFLPYGQEQVIDSARPHFRLVASSSGRLDYIETIRQWRKRFAAPSLRKTLLKLQLLPRWLTSADFRLAFTSGVSANSACFERELLDHYRLVFEKAE